MGANPKCEHCNHPRSFHRDGGECQVGSCDCHEFVAPVEDSEKVE